jgi:hypothetical protein
MAGLWFMSVDIYTNILIIVTTTLLITTKYHTWIHFVILFIVTFFAYICFILIVHQLTVFNSVGTMQVAFTSPVMWLNIVLICGFSGLIEYFILSFAFVLRPNTVKILQRIFNQNGAINSEENLPKSIKEKIGLYNEIEQKIENEEIKKDEVLNPSVQNKFEKEEIIDTNVNKVNEINTNTNVNLNENKELEKIKEETEEDLKSEEVKLNTEEVKTDYGNNNDNNNDVNILKANPQLNNSKINNENDKNDKSKEEEKEEEDLGENYGEDFSEKMSQEGNIIYASNNYFLKPWNLKTKASIKKSK